MGGWDPTAVNAFFVLKKPLVQLADTKGWVAPEKGM